MKNTKRTFKTVLAEKAKQSGCKTFVSIHDYAVWDQAGEAVSCSFDPHALESMFSQPDFDV